MNGGIVNGGIAKMYRAKPKQLDFYKSETRLPTTNHYAESSGEDMEHFMNPIGRSKSLHDLQQFPPSTASIHQRKEAAKEQIGLSEHDLNRARSVLGLPLTEPYNTYVSSNSALTGFSFEAEKNDLDLGYDSQPGSKRNSMNVSKTKTFPMIIYLFQFTELVSGSKKDASRTCSRSGSRSGYRDHRSQSRSQGYNRRQGENGHVSVTPWDFCWSPNYELYFQLQAPGGARVSFPSPCITSTRQLTDQSSTSHPSSPPSPSPGPAKPPEADPSIAMLKQYYLDCILKIDPNHPVGQTFPKVSHIENKHKVVNNSANILRCAMDQKFSFDLTNQLMIKV